MKDIKLGIIGTNFVSDWLCDTVDTAEGIVNDAVCSRTAEKGADFAKKHAIPHVYTDYDAFFTSDIDAVYIASPNFLHESYARRAIEAGKHVLLEKPATLNEQQFLALDALAREHGVILMEAMRPGHDPAVALARDAMGKIGTIRRAVFDFCQYSSRYDKFKAGEVLNAFDPSLGNAALMDIGCYAVHVCVMLFGRPESVYARSLKLANGMEGMGTIFLDYGAMQAEVVYSKITESYNPSVITGEDGVVLLGKLSTMESVSLCRRGAEPETLLRRDADTLNMAYEVDDFVAAVRGELDTAAFTETTRTTLAIMDEVRRQNDITFPTEA